jgi:hypothetical protein
MKNIMLRLFAIIILLVTVAFASALASVSAQTPGHNITANIPFEFNVGDKTLPAGQYSVARINSDGTQLRISNREDGASRLTQTVQDNEPKEQSVLVFNRYGDRYFLSQVWLTGERVGREMLKSRSEKAIGQELAKNNAEAETVTVIAAIH